MKLKCNFIYFENAKPIRISDHAATLRNSTTMKKLFLYLFIIGFQTVNAQLRLPSIFADHMVLQQQSEVALWGWASPGQKIAIKPGWSQDTVKTVSANTGKWTAKVLTPV